MHKATHTADTLSAVYGAMDRKRPVTVTYIRADGAETVRTIEVYEVFTSKAGHTIIRTMDRESGESRSWRLDRIQAYTVHRGSCTMERMSA